MLTVSVDGWGGLVPVFSPRKYRFGPGSFHVWFAVDEVIMGQIFVRVLRFFPVTIIPPVLPTHFHVPFALSRRTCEWNPCTFQKAVFFFPPKIEEHWIDKEFHSFAFKRWVWFLVVGPMHVDLWKPACSVLQWKTPKCTADTKSDRLCEWNWQSYVFVYVPGPTSCFRRTVPKSTSFIFNSYPVSVSFMDNAKRVDIRTRQKRALCLRLFGCWVRLLSTWLPCCVVWYIGTGSAEVSVDSL